MMIEKLEEFSMIQSGELISKLILKINELVEEINVINHGETVRK